MNNCIRIRCLSPFHYRFIFVDTKDFVFVRLLSGADICVSHVKEMMKRGSPYRLLVCNVRKKDLDKFSEILKSLRNNILILGYRDYDVVCSKLKEAESILSGRKKREAKVRKNVKFFLIYDRILGKEENGRYFLYKNKQWILDGENVIIDHLMGYDPSESSDSPYGIGCTDIMNGIKEISDEKATELIGEV